MKKLTPWIICLLILFAVSAALIAYSLLGDSAGKNDIACTMEAKMCPDGTAVGRIGPKCEFAPCPVGAGGKPVTGDAPSEEECLSKGGIWQRWGMLPQEYCQIPVSDAYKICTDGADCSLGKCIAEEGKVPGKCQPYKNVFGCMQFVENGKVSEGAMCID